MASVNRVIILGNLGRDPEIRYTSDGERAIANLSIATSNRYKDKTSGDFREQTEWHKVVLYNRLAEVAREYLKKGQAVYVEGKLQTKKWQDKNGQDRYTTEIVGDNMQMLGSGTGDVNDNSSNVSPSDGSSVRTSVPNAGGTAVAKGFEDLDDDIPF